MKRKLNNKKTFQGPLVAKYEAEKLKYQKLMDKVPEEVKQFEMFVKHCHGFLLQVKEKAKAEKRQKKAIATGRNAAAELKVGVGFKSRYIFPRKQIHVVTPGYASEFGKA